MGRSSRRTVVVVLAFVALLATGCSSKREGDGSTAERAAARSTSTSTSTTVAGSAGCTAAAKPSAGTADRTFAFDGKDRTYLLHVPATYSGTKPVPVVFEFHGHGSSAAQQIVYGDFRPLAEQHGFLVVAPDGQGSPRHFTYAAGAEQDDVAFTVALLDQLETELCIDTRRVFATGMSNGGALSSVIACRASDRFAAVAPVAAFFYYPDCAKDGRPAPIVAMMGTADPVVPYAGGTVNCCGNPNIPAAEDTMAKFASRSDCDEPFVEDRPSPSIRHRHWSGCAVELYAVEGGGHTWPGSPVKVARLGATTDELIATDTIWQFFTEHPLPAGS